MSSSKIRTSYSKKISGSSDSTTHTSENQNVSRLVLSRKGSIHNIVQCITKDNQPMRQKSNSMHQSSQKPKVKAEGSHCHPSDDPFLNAKLKILLKSEKKPETNINKKLFLFDQICFEQFTDKNRTTFKKQCEILANPQNSLVRQMHERQRKINQ